MTPYCDPHRADCNRHCLGLSGMHGLFDQVMHTMAGAAGSVVNWRVLLLSHHSPIPSLYKFLRCGKVILAFRLG